VSYSHISNLQRAENLDKRQPAVFDEVDMVEVREKVLVHSQVRVC